MILDTARTMPDAPFEAVIDETLPAGEVLANRYEILALIGQGGMGAVYRAYDRELQRDVALKTIRAELSSQSQFLDRFRREVAFSSRITHRNVVRVFDLGSAGKLRFLTMEFVEGKGLDALIGPSGLPPEEVAPILRQICLGLDAAHEEGVIHRDLKPPNIMIDSQGRVAVMDFGLASTIEGSTLTRAGTLLGTPDYMSPEQALGRKLDPRSDIFSLGIIGYEMLTGKAPFKSDTMIASLVARTRERAPALREIKLSVPEGLSRIVDRCLGTDPAERYASVKEMIRDLDEYLGQTHNRERPSGVTPMEASALVPSAGAAAKPVQERRRPGWIPVAVAGFVLASVAAWYGLTHRSQALPAKAQPISILVADFVNRTGDPAFDGALEPTLGLALEGANFVNTYNRGTAKRVAGQLQPGTTQLDERLARLVALREGIATVLTGEIRKDGDGFAISVKVLDGVSGKLLGTASKTAADRSGVLNVAAALATPIRKTLGEANPPVAAETYTAASIEAAQAYSRGQELRFLGRVEDGIAQYKEAIRLDPNLGSAYYGLASTYANVGRRQLADMYYKLALARLDRMTERERLRTRGGYYLMTLNHGKAIEEFTQLVEKFPADTGGLSNLAYVYYLQRNMPKALELARRVVNIYPKIPLYRSNYAMYLMYSSDFAGAEREAGTVIAESPSYVKAFNTVALSQLGQNQTDKAAETYAKLSALNSSGASFAAMGMADLLLFQSRADEAAGVLKKGIQEDLAADRKSAAAKKSAVLGEAYAMLGRKADAIAAVATSVQESQEMMTFYTVATVYLDSGAESKAKALATELDSKLDAEPQMYAKLIRAAIEIRRNQPREALRLLQEAQNTTDTWLGHLLRAQAYLLANAFTEANSELDTCMRRRGEAVELFLDESQTYRRNAEAVYYLARTQQGMASPGAENTFRQFLAFKSEKATDPLVQDARRRLSTR
jgi:eukaryotic-like serine/threonine-protein kinase